MDLHRRGQRVCDRAQDVRGDAVAGQDVGEVFVGVWPGCVSAYAVLETELTTFNRSARLGALSTETQFPKANDRTFPIDVSP
jgi:hypothetical protein